MPKLVIPVPNIGEVTHELTADEITIGRGPDNKIQIKDFSVAPHQARLLRSNGFYRLEDLRSGGKTFVDGNPIDRRDLQTSCVLKFGSVETFFRIDPAADPATRLEGEIAKLKQKMEAVRQARDLVHQRNEQLLLERQEIADARDIALAELSEARRIAGAGRKQKDDSTEEAVQAKVRELTAAIETLERKVRESEAAAAQAGATLREHETSAEQRQEGMRNDFEARLEEQRKQVLVLIDERKAAQARTSEAIRSAAELEEQVQMLAEARDRAEKGGSALQQQLKDSEAEIARLKEERSRTAGDLENRLADLEKSKVAVEQRLAAQLTELEATRSGTENDKSVIARLSTELDSARQQIDFVTHERDGLRKQHQRLLGELDEQHGKVSADQAAKDAEQARLREQLREIETQLAAERERTNGAAGRILEIERQLGDAAAAAESAGREKNEAVAARDSLSREVEKQGTDLDRLREDFQRIERERDTAGSAVRSLESEKAALSADREAARNEIEQLRKKIEDDLRSSAERQAQMQRRVDQFANQAADTVARMESIRQESAARERQLTEQLGLAEREIAELEKQRTALLNSVGRASSAAAPAPMHPPQTARVDRPVPRAARDPRAREQHLDRETTPSETVHVEEVEPAPPIEAPAPAPAAKSVRLLERAVAPVKPEQMARDLKKIEKLPENILQMRRSLQYLIRHPKDRKALDQLVEQATAMTAAAEPTVFQALHCLCRALASLVRDFAETPERINQATLRTVTQTLDFVSAMVEERTLQRTLEIGNAHVLAIDDEPDIADAIVSAMELVGLHGEGAHEANTGLDRMEREKFDLIFLDVRLPDISGWDVCSRFRGMPEYKRTPIVFLTGLASIENKVQSTLQGGNDFIGKPFNLRELGVKALTWVYKSQLGMT